MPHPRVNYKTCYRHDLYKIGTNLDMEFLTRKPCTMLAYSIIKTQEALVRKSLMTVVKSTDFSVPCFVNCKQMGTRGKKYLLQFLEQHLTDFVGWLQNGTLHLIFLNEMSSHVGCPPSGAEN